MGDIFKKVRDFKDRAVKWWGALRPKQKTAVLVGAGIIGFSFMVGGVFLQASVGAAITIGLLGMEFHDSPRMNRFMKKHGRKVDYALTILGVLSGPGGGVTAILFGFLLGGFFTLLRTLIWDGEEAPKAEIPTCPECAAKKAVVEVDDVLQTA